MQAVQQEERSLREVSRTDILQTPAECNRERYLGGWGENNIHDVKSGIQKFEDTDFVTFYSALRPLEI